MAVEQLIEAWSEKVNRAITELQASDRAPGFFKADEWVGRAWDDYRAGREHVDYWMRQR